MCAPKKRGVVCLIVLLTAQGIRYDQNVRLDDQDVARENEMSSALESH